MYIRLLCLQHQKGHLTERDMLCTCNAYVDNVFAKFTKDDKGLFYNVRMDIEINKRVNYCKGREKNAKNRWVSKRNAYAMHTEDENENENSIGINNTIEDACALKDSPQKAIEARAEEFKNELKLKSQYPDDVLSAFYDYWSEPNRSKTKMRFELQPTWDLSRRLKTWANRETVRNKSSPRYGRQEPTMDELRAQAERIKLT